MYSLLSIACIIWGLNVLVIKEMLNFMPMLFLASVRIWITVFSLLILCLMKGITIQLKMNRNILYVSLYIVVFNFVCTFIGMKTETGSTVAITNGLTPFIMMFFLSTLNKQIKNPLSLLSFFCAVGAIFLSVGLNWQESFMNVCFLILGLCFYSKGSVLLQSIIDDDNYLLCTLQYQCIGAVILSLLSLSIEYDTAIQIQQIPMNLVILFVLFSGLGFAFIQVIYSKSIYKLGNIKTSYFTSLTPVVTFIASFIIFGETIKLNTLISIVLLISSIILLNISKSTT